MLLLTSLAALVVIGLLPLTTATATATATATDQPLAAGPAERRSCPTEFWRFRQQYLNCVTNVWPAQGANQQGPITLARVVGALREYCAGLNGYETCFLSPFRDCQEDLVEFLNNLWRLSSWVCDGEFQVRPALAHALLTADDNSVPPSQTTADQCITPSQSRTCVTRTIQRFSFVQSLNVHQGIQVPVTEVFANPQSTEYFQALFDCFHDDIAEFCPHNAIAMALVGGSRLLFPPKFGINVSEIILNTYNADNTN